MFKKLLALAAGLMLAAAAQAVGTYTGAVTYVHTMSNGHLLIGTNAITGQPSCATANGNRWVLDATTTGGKQQAAWLQSNFILGKNITITGSGVCPSVAPLWGNEIIDYITVNP